MTACPVTVTAGGVTAGASFSVRRAYGVNGHVYATVTPALTGVNFVKLFASTAGVPASWPGTGAAQPAPPGCTALVCFKPVPAQLLAGQLDAQISAWLKQAPAGSWVTAWQEGNDPGSGFWACPGATPALLAQVHAYLAALIARVAPQVRYGQVFGSYPVYHQGQDCTAYTVPGLHFYSFDGYGGRQAEIDPATRQMYTPAAVFTGLAQIRAKWPDAPVAITETNTNFVTTNPASAGAWFTGAYAVAKRYNAILFCTFWGLASDPSTQVTAFSAAGSYVAALNAIAADCAA